MRKFASKKSILYSTDVREFGSQIKTSLTTFLQDNLTGKLVHTFETPAKLKYRVGGNLSPDLDVSMATERFLFITFYSFTNL
jgi:hypothetical protein